MLDALCVPAVMMLEYRLSTNAATSGVEPEVTFTGGVAKNPAMIETLTQRLGVRPNVSADSHFMGALGAALRWTTSATGSPRY